MVLICSIECAGCQGRRGFSRVMSAAGCYCTTGFGHHRALLSEKVGQMNLPHCIRTVLPHGFQTNKGALTAVCTEDRHAHTISKSKRPKELNNSLCHWQYCRDARVVIAHHFRGLTMARAGLFNSGQWREDAGKHDQACSSGG